MPAVIYLGPPPGVLVQEDYDEVMRCLYDRSAGDAFDFIELTSRAPGGWSPLRIRRDAVLAIAPATPTDPASPDDNPQVPTTQGAESSE